MWKDVASHECDLGIVAVDRLDLVPSRPREH